MLLLVGDEMLDVPVALVVEFPQGPEVLVDDRVVALEVRLIVCDVVPDDRLDPVEVEAIQQLKVWH